MYSFTAFCHYKFFTFEMHSSHKGNLASAPILFRHILQNGSDGFTVTPSPTSRNSIDAPCVKPYFFLSSCGITILPSLSTFLITPPKKQKVRPPKQTHKNANSDSRQTNPCTIGKAHRQRFGICILSNSIFFCGDEKKDIFLRKEKYTDFAIFD